MAGVVVVALEQAVAAPFATRQLADLGARVIKIERPGVGDLARGYDTTVNGLASHFVWLNAGKESVELDIKSERGRRILTQLIDRADVLVQNLAPGATDRMGFDAATLRQTRPRLITCDISGYGSGGPFDGKKAYDLLIQCEAGLVSITGAPDDPAKVGISIADIAAGMYAFSGILTALYDREHSGQGAALEVSMLEALGEWMGYPLLYTVYGKTPPVRAGASHATIAPYGPFTCGDGIVINLGLQNQREWVSFCSNVLCLPELADDARFGTNYARVAHRDELDKVIADTFEELDATAARERLDAASIAWSEQRTMHAFAEHPQLRARGRWTSLQTPTGDVNALRPPVTVSGVESTLGPVPTLGEHTESVLSWLGDT